MISTENNSARLLDLFFCLVFMPFLVFLGPAHSWMGSWTLFFLITTAYLYGCYFLIQRVNFPALLIERRFARIATVGAALIFITYLLSRYPLPALDFVTPAMSQYQIQLRDFGVSVSLWLMFSLVVGYALTVSFVKELYGQLFLKKKIEAQRDKAELAVFKAQISPHFLFNTLNSLYSLVIGTSPKAEDAFIKFTDILKYTYITIEKETVAVADEIAYIGSYIDLQAIRLNCHTSVNWNFDIDDDSLRVPPMLMLTFVENTFKYGSSTSIDCTIDITLSLRDGLLRFETRNHVMKHQDQFRKDIPVGVENSRARLAALFPGRHTLLAENAPDGTFHVLLTIKLK